MTVENAIALRNERGWLGYNQPTEPRHNPWMIKKKKRREKKKRRAKSERRAEEERGEEKKGKKVEKKRKEGRTACLKGAWCDSIAKDSSSEAWILWAFRALFSTIITREATNYGFAWRASTNQEEMEERRRRVDRLADRGWGDRGEQALEIDERWKMGWKLKCSPCVLFFPRLFDESVLAAYFPFLLSLSLSLLFFLLISFYILEFVLEIL